MQALQRSIFNQPAKQWCITTYFGDLLEEAENRFGPRLLEYTPIGVTLRDGGPNQLLPLSGTSKRFVVLESKYEHDLDGALFPLAHEVIHLLAPVTKANCLEEGLATFFSIDNRHVRNDANKVKARRDYLRDKAPLYFQALLRFEKFVENGGDIKMIRLHEPYLSKMTADLIKLCVPRCDDKLIAELLGFIDDLKPMG